jgi:predicted TIM-barrel fold metal-dependent hydrolase
MARDAASEPEIPATPSRPRWRPPAGACDAHAHTLGPFDRYPVANGDHYEPPLAPYEAYRAMLDRVGFTRGVLVQASAYGMDMAALRDALSRGGGNVLGVGFAIAQTSDDALEDMLEAGIRGFRFIDVPDHRTGQRYLGSVPFDELEKLAPRLRDLGMHGQLWAPCGWIADNRKRLAKLNLPLSIDHMGQFDIARGVGDQTFRTLCELARDGVVYVKLPLCRVSKQFPEYADARPFHEALVKASPSHLLWGSDWPHIRLGPLSPDVGHLIDLFHDWVGDESLSRKILVDNPRALYGFA